MTNERQTETPHRVRLRLDGADLVFTVFAKDKYHAMQVVQEKYPKACVVDALGSPRDGEVYQW